MTTSSTIPLAAAPGTDLREPLIAGLPVTERRLDLAGIPTSVLEGGDGPPMVLLHGPTEFAAKWFRVIPQLARSHRVIAPDLPGHGATGAPERPIDAEGVLAWLGELIDRTCEGPPTLVGHIVGGAIAARFAARRPGAVRRLVLVDTLGLAPFQPSPEFGAALMELLRQPGEDTQERLWERCAFDFERLRGHFGESWRSFAAYQLDGLRNPAGQPVLHALMEHFGFPPIPAAELRRIRVPVALVWGRHDLATRLDVAQAASAEYGWPLRVVEDCADDPPLEQPEAFLAALANAFDPSASAATPDGAAHA